MTHFVNMHNLLPYQFSAEPTGTHMMLLRAVTPKASVLDVGCATGYLGTWLIKNREARVWGIEPFAAAAEQARAAGYEEVYTGQIEEVLTSQTLVDKKFEYILLGDVLEHLVDPEQILKKLTELLVPGGRCVVSVPNVAHYSVRLNLLFGRWNMTDTGIMDRTHLHFYTRKTVVKLVEQAGLVIESVRPRGDIDRWFARVGMAKLGQWILHKFHGWWAIQTVIVAKK